MIVILWAFTLFHLVVGLASLGMAVRLLGPVERSHWRSKVALLVAELLCWIYPVAALVAVKSAWSAHDVGHPMALAAIDRGVGSCMQEAWARMRIPLASHFTLPDEEMIYCGMALGYADETKAVNTLRADRASVDEFATFKGF